MDDRQRIENIFASFREVNQAFHQSMMQLTQHLGITAIQYFVLKVIVHHPGIGLNELSEKIHSVTSSTSGIVDRMVKAGWLLRERPASNRRAICLTATEEGKALWHTVSEMRISQLATSLLNIPEEDERQLIRIHKQIVNIIQRQREEENHE
ncbi:MarR family winged helix-turn-helix transcriptional regulator [Cohnella cholangitidis]|uniref:MarR family transcriptional regulator n=1 Tax=Cohnella cholangitidis TaxID=2598458 RepID=A0A7G5BSN8_9BACL|nr:MarR family transcriptional regulator [Cohnella cholangitidis]QMV39972.1 MarR family transcriptional regulator [Cohnella cholangitidis]